MMSEGGQTVMYWLLGAVGLLIVAIFIPLIKRILSASATEPGKIAKPELNSSPAAAPTIVSGPEETPELSQTPPQEQVSIHQALSGTRKNFFGRIQSLFKDETAQSHLDEIEEILYTSDLGPQTVQRLMQPLQENLSRSEKRNIETVKNSLKNEILNIFKTSEISLDHSVDFSEGQGEPHLFSKIKFSENKPTVLMVVGVNGAGKTTSIGKISAQLAQNGKKVLVAAGDTFRAAAGSQLQAWTDRAQVEIFSPAGVIDPSAVAFDAVAKAQAQGYDVVIIDTAGRLHTQANLMEELRKVKRVMAKILPSAPHEILIVLDANSGQNALIQAREFNNSLGLTGAILTKMDGTAKGGVAVGLACELKLPIKLIGVGEKIQDLRAFSSTEFVDSLFE